VIIGFGRIAEKRLIMGKKSKAKAAPSLRCVKCKVFVKSVDRGVECPGCDDLFCYECAYGESRGNAFIYCDNMKTAPLVLVVKAARLVLHQIRFQRRTKKGEGGTKRRRGGVMTGA